MANKRKKYLIGMVIIILILAGGILLRQLSGQNGSNQKFRLAKVERGEVSLAVTATGTINPVINVLVGSQVSGTIKALYADFNSQVKEGQVIAQIDPAIFEAQVEQGRASVLNARANLLNAQANLENAKANLTKADVAVLDAKRTLDRNQPLLEKKIIAQATLDTAQTNYDTAVAQTDVAKAQVESAKSQIESFKAQVEQTKAALRVAETNLRYATIRSPVNGTVISRNVDVGQTVAASLQAPTLFTIAKNLAEMQVDSNVSEADVGRIAAGQDATFTVDAYPERIFHGKVSEIRNAPIIVQNVVTYDVVILVGNKDLKLKPGMTANVSVMIAHREGVLKIPNAALRFRPESAKKESGKGGPPQKPSERVKPAEGDQGRPGKVWVLSPEGKPTPVSITLGITDGTSSEVMGGNLQEGAEVIIEGNSNKKGQSQSGSVPFMPRMRK
ncbi:MAG: efflux transporter, family, subunit [Deltaproteobacteria bacterium]|jgi:HlyD family secretion protein|nr:efflux transporter, family, subunit [Deltaproteobacteria bacterium]